MLTYIPEGEHIVTRKRVRAEPPAPGTPVSIPEVSTLETRVPAALLRSIRLHAALGAKTLDDFVREAIEERLRG